MRWPHGRARGESFGDEDALAGPPLEQPFLQTDARLVSKREHESQGCLQWALYGDQ